MTNIPVSHFETDAVTPVIDSDLESPRALAIDALDGAEWHARRSGSYPTRAAVWATAAVVYALLEVAKQIKVGAQAGGKKRG